MITTVVVEIISIILFVIIITFITTVFVLDVIFASHKSSSKKCEETVIYVYTALQHLFYFSKGGTVGLVSAHSVV